jgi:hypothetical protein
MPAWIKVRAGVSGLEPDTCGPVRYNVVRLDMSGKKVRTDVDVLGPIVRSESVIASSAAGLLQQLEYRAANLEKGRNE